MEKQIDTITEIIFPKYKYKIEITDDWVVNTTSKINFIYRFFMRLFLGWKITKF